MLPLSILSSLKEHTVSLKGTWSSGKGRRPHTGKDVGGTPERAAEDRRFGVRQTSSLGHLLQQPRRNWTFGSPRASGVQTPRASPGGQPAWDAGGRGEGKTEGCGWGGEEEGTAGREGWSRHGWQARKTVTLAGLMETKGEPVPRYQGCSAQGSLEPVVSGKWERQLAPYGHGGPPPLGSIGRATCLIFKTRLDIQPPIRIQVVVAL